MMRDSVRITVDDVVHDLGGEDDPYVPGPPKFIVTEVSFLKITTESGNPLATEG